MYMETYQNHLIHYTASIEANVLTPENC